MSFLSEYWSLFRQMLPVLFVFIGMYPFAILGTLLILRWK